MPLTILHQGAGWTIAREDVAHTAIPYGPEEHGDGDVNHGFMDLRDRPDLAAEVPEAAGHPGFGALLVAVNEPGSCLMSFGCECALFPLAREDGLNFHAGSYVDVTFRDPCHSRDVTALVDLAKDLLRGVPASKEHVVGFEMIVQPLHDFYGVQGCYGLLVKAHGYGSTADEAWSAFDHAAYALASAARRVAPLASARRTEV